MKSLTDVRLQKDDPGTIQIAGYSAGSHSHPLFDWARNLRSKKIPEDEVSCMNYRISSAFAFFWNLCRSWLPPKIIADLDDFMTRTGILAMGSDQQHAPHDGDYEATIGGLLCKFSDVRLAPPQGVMAVNYSRYSTSFHNLFSDLNSALGPSTESDNPMNGLYPSIHCERVQQLREGHSILLNMGFGCYRHQTL